MAAKIPVDEHDNAWLQSYAAAVLQTFETEFRNAGDRFANWKPLLHHFSDAVNSLSLGRSARFGALDEWHNELCVASALLAT